MHAAVHLVLACLGCGAVGVRICRSVRAHLRDYRLCAANCREVKTAAMATTARSSTCIGTTMAVRSGVAQKQECHLASRVSFGRNSVLASRAGVSGRVVNVGVRWVGAVKVMAVNSASTAAASPTATKSEKSVAKPTVLVAEKLGAAGIELLEKVAVVDCSYNLSQEDLCAKISDCDALIVRSGTKVTREVFEASKGRLKVIFCERPIFSPYN